LETPSHVPMQKDEEQGERDIVIARFDIYNME
jgi:hypothetical protein